MLKLSVMATILFSATTVAAAPSFITSKTPYEPRQDYAEYSEAPQGYALTMIQHVARHGSRGLSSADDDVLLMQVLQQARQEDALTPLGKTLIDQVAELTRVQNIIGYGKLSTLGIEEHEQIAARITARHPDFFSTSPRHEQPILFSHSGRARAAQSGEAFISGLLATVPSVKAQLQTPYASEATLYFHKAEGADDYQEYKDSDPRILTAISELETSDTSRQAVTNILNPLFTPEFIARLASGEYLFSANDGEDTIEGPLDVVSALFGIYAIAPDLVLDSDTLDITPYIPEQDAAWLAYVDDADSFYGRGPGFTGNDITYRAANALFEEMLGQIDSLQRSPADAPLASFRFTHAQVLMPVATWLQLDGTEVTVDEGERYTYANNPWRSAEISPMAANVQWEVYQNSQNDLLVRMLHNEAEVHFPDTCKAIEDNSYFYDFSEIKQCLTTLHGLAL